MDEAKVKDVVERLRGGSNDYQTSITLRLEGAILIESLSAELAALREGGDVGLETSATHRAQLAALLKLSVGDPWYLTTPIHRDDELEIRGGQDANYDGTSVVEDDVCTLADDDGQAHGNGRFIVEARNRLPALLRDFDKLLARTGQTEPQTGDMVLVPRAILRAIAEGYKTTGEDDRFIVVENPDFEPDNGKDPNLVIDTFFAFAPQPDRASPDAGEVTVPTGVLMKQWLDKQPPTRQAQSIVDHARTLLVGGDVVAYELVLVRDISVALTAARAAGAAEATAKIVGWLRDEEVERLALAKQARLDNLPVTESVQEEAAAFFRRVTVLIQSGEHLKEKG